MAMRACSLNTSLPLYQSLPSKPSSQIPTTHFSSLLKQNSNVFILEDTFTVNAVVEAVSLANAAAEAAKDAVSSAVELRKLELDWLTSRQGCSVQDTTARRRKRRMRMRRKQVEFDEDGDYSGWYLVKGCSSSKLQRSKYLTRKQEAEFSLYLKVGAMLDTAESSTAVVAERRNRDMAFLRARECRERITLSYKRLVVSIATPYQGKGLSLQDLIQEGCIGLLHGAQRFDHKKGCKLSTYVYWWIKQAIIKAITNKSSIVRSPGSFRGVMTKVRDAKSLLRRRLKRSPTYDEIANFLKLGVAIVQLASERNANPISIDRSLNIEGLTLKDIIPGADEIRPEVMINRQMMLQKTEELLTTLTEREKHIIRLHYGLNGGNAQSCEEIGRLLDLSRERIRQIHCNALTKLREAKCTIECFAPNIM